MSGLRVRVGSILWIKEIYYAKCFTCGKEIAPPKGCWRRSAILGERDEVVRRIDKSPFVCDECIEKLAGGT